MFGNDTLYYKVQYPNITSQIGHLVRLFLAFMHAWNMPMFFYLSGQNAYAALFRRSETQFRNERTHRLIVPTLFMSVVAQFPLTLGYFAPHDDPLEESFLEYVRGFYRLLNVHQAWFLMYLFIYAQMFTHCFRAFHPVHNTPESTTLSYCGSTSCCCTAKPFNCLTKVFCCLNCLFKPAVTPEKFVSAVTWFLGGPIRLALFPGILLGIVQAANNVLPIETIVSNDAIVGTVRRYPFMPYMVIYLLGYCTAAADQEIRQDNQVWSWMCFIFGTILCIAYGPIELVLSGISRNIAKGFIRGMGQWLFLVGSLSLAKKVFPRPRLWHKKLRKMAMPFYMIHQVF